jgi:hypothetical protein
MLPSVTLPGPEPHASRLPIQLSKNSRLRPTTLDFRLGILDSSLYLQRPRFYASSRLCQIIGNFGSGTVCVSLSVFCDGYVKLL